MSYQKDLDEFDSAELTNELLRRKAARKKGNCDYCNRPGCDPTCRFPERHAVARTNLVRLTALRATSAHPEEIVELPYDC